MPVATPIFVRPNGTQAGTAGVLPSASTVALAAPATAPPPAVVGAPATPISGTGAPTPTAQAHVTILQLFLEVAGVAAMTFFAGESDGAGDLMLVIIAGFWIIWLIHKFSS